MSDLGDSTVSFTLIVQMPLNHGQGNLGGEARGNDTGSSTRDSHPSGRKRKTVFQEAEINQSSQTWEQSYATFTPDDSDGEATGLGGVEIRGDYHIFKKHKATTESLLSGTHMEELCVVIPPVINSPSASSATFPAITSDQHLSAGESKPSSTSTQTRPVRHLVNDCVGNAASVTPKQKGHTNARARAGLSGKSSDEISGIVSVVQSYSTKHL